MTGIAAPAGKPLSGPTGRRVAAHRGELHDVLRRHGVTNPELFGSAARGDDCEDSDVDILVDFAAGTSIIDIIGIQRELEELLGVPVDLVPRNGLKERVRARAAKDLLQVTPPNAAFTKRQLEGNFASERAPSTGRATAAQWADSPHCPPA